MIPCLCLFIHVNSCFVKADYPDQARFSWSHYLEETGSKAVAAEAFKVVRTKNKWTGFDWIYWALLHFLLGESEVTRLETWDYTDWYHPRICFQRAPHSFQTKMKLEAVDKRSPGLIRVATVEEVETHRIKVIVCSCLATGQNIYTWMAQMFSEAEHLQDNVAYIITQHPAWVHVFFFRSIMTDGVTSMTSGWTRITLTFTQQAGARPPVIR